jgi:hypothetical protein
LRRVTFKIARFVGGITALSKHGTRSITSGAIELRGGEKQSGERCEAKAKVNRDRRERKDERTEETRDARVAAAKKMGEGAHLGYQVLAEVYVLLGYVGDGKHGRYYVV